MLCEDLNGTTCPFLNEEARSITFSDNSFQVIVSPPQIAAVFSGYSPAFLWR